MKDSGYRFYDQKQGKFHKGDLILIPFGEELPSIYQVESARGKKLLVLVLEDNDLKSKIKRGTICDIGTSIYEGYWCHRRIPKVKPIKVKVHTEKP